MQIHHGYYDRDFEPWDYPLETLWTLCKNCHEETGKDLLAIKREIGMVEPCLLPRLLSLLAHIRTDPRIIAHGNLEHLSEWAWQSRYHLARRHALSIGGEVDAEVRGVKAPNGSYVTLSEILNEGRAEVCT